MNKFIMLTTGLLMTAAAATTHAQSSYLSIGPTAALGHSWVRSVPANGDRNFKFAPAFGIGLMYSRYHHWGFGTGLQISHEGYKADYRLRNGDKVDVSVNPVYLRMPMNVTYFFGRYGDRVRPKIYAGPSFALKIDEKNWGSDDGRTVEGNMANSDDFRNWDAGINVGTGANIRLARYTWLNLDLGYYHGLVDVMKNDANGDFNANRNLRVNVGLMWGL